MSSINLTPQRSETKLVPSLSFIVIFVLVMVAGGFLFLAFMPVILPTGASTQAEQVDRIFGFMLFIGAMVFVLVQGLLVVSVVKWRVRPGDRADGPPVHGNTTLEAVWTAIPTLIVTVIAIYSLTVYSETRIVAPSEQAVGAIGARYAWTFNYTISQEDLPAGIDFNALKPEIQADLSDEDGVITFSSTKLYTWVGRPTVVRMNAADVNHAFWIPAMRVKQDVLAGRTTEIRFTPTQAGSFRVVCAELCGAGHGNMAGEVVTDPATGEEFLSGAWVIVYESEEAYLREFFEPSAITSLLPPDDPVLVGRQILASGKYPCNTCHVLADLNWVGVVGPNLNGIGDRADDRAAQSGEVDATAYLIHSIRHPGDWLVPGFGNLMPQFNPDPGQANYMPDSDLNAIVAYLLAQTAAAQASAGSSTN
jgi:cytochrome c oxidase subunit 2